MAKKPVPVLKGYFNRGDKPTEGQFSDVMDSFRHKDDALSIHEIEGLTQQLSQYPTNADVQTLLSTRLTHVFTTASPSVTVAASKLVFYIVLRSFMAQTVSVKAEFGSYDELLVTDMDLDANKPMVLAVQLYSFSAFNIRLTGQTSNIDSVLFLL
jgi:hypothetical protein